MAIAVRCQETLLKNICVSRQSLLRLFRVFSVVFPAIIAALSVMAQETPVQPSDGTALIGQLSAAFSGGHLMHQVTLSGNATWHVGGVEDSGPATLTTSTDGQVQMSLQLSKGQKQETRSGTGRNAVCSWTGSDGVAHNADLVNCWTPAVWFLPAISLQTSLLSNSLVASDLGQGTVGSGTDTYRHLQTQSYLTGLPTSIAANLTKQGTTDIGLDPATVLPSVLTYKVRPDNGASTPIAIEVRYSDYRDVNGVKIPFLVQRYVNNSLQLEIAVQSALIN